MSGGEKLLIGSAGAVVAILVLKRMTATAPAPTTPTVVGSGGNPVNTGLTFLSKIPVIGPTVPIVVAGDKYLVTPAKKIVQKVVINPLNTAIGAGTTTVTANGIQIKNAKGPVGWYDKNIGVPVSTAITSAGKGVVSGVKSVGKDIGHAFSSIF